jgi:hypothetical protein
VAGQYVEAVCLSGCVFWAECALCRGSVVEAVWRGRMLWLCVGGRVCSVLRQCSGGCVLG